MRTTGNNCREDENENEIEHMCKQLESNKLQLMDFEKNIQIFQVLNKYREHPLFSLELKYQQLRLKGVESKKIGESYIEYFYSTESPNILLKGHFILFFIAFGVLSCNVKIPKRISS